MRVFENMIVNLITTVYNFLWGDLFTIPLPGGGSLGISLLILLLIPTGIYFTIRTRFLPIRLFPDMIRALSEKKSARLPRLSKLRSHSFTKKKILCTAATAAVLPTTFTIWLKTTSRRKNDTFCRLFCLPLPV